MTGTLDRLLDGRHLDEQEADALLVALAGERLAPALAGAVLAALRAKGETAAELRGFARALRRLARAVPVGAATPLVDVVGTGGDGSHSLNLSTGTALLAAAGGQRVVKHGNRSVSSRCGSADVLEALRVRLPADGAAAVRMLDSAGFTFLFAPAYHPAMKAIAPVRGALGVRTVFNVLGPLVNPARPSHLLVGAYSPAVARLMAEALAGLPLERAFVVHGSPGWDEATPCGPFLLLDVHGGRVTETRRDPSEYGLARCRPEDLRGGEAAYNAAALEAVLRGARGPHRDALVLGGALVAELTGRAGSARAAAAEAAAPLDDGRAAVLLDALRRLEQEEVRRAC